MSSDIRTFQADIKRFAAKERERATQVFRRVCGEVTENVVSGGRYGPGTPVKTGFARNSWVSGINAPGEYVQPSRPGDLETVVPNTSAAGANVGSVKLGDRYFLTSNTVYQRRLDYGHSQQAPAGHVRLVMDQLPQIVSDVLHEDLPVFAGAGA